MTEKERLQIKKNIDEMSSKIFDYICAAEPDSEEREHRYMEIACSFLGAALDYSKDMDQLAKDIMDYTNDLRVMSLVTAYRFKTGTLPDERKLSEFGGNEND